MKTRAILVHDILKAGFGTVEVGAPGEGEVLASAEVSLVSTGTELRIFRQGHPNTEFPIVPGYSAVGTIREVGNGVAEFSEGDLVCLMGSNRITQGAQVLWGAHCHWHTVPAASLIKLSPDCSPDKAAFIPVVGVALHGVTFADIDPGERVVVIGLGLIGQCSVRNLLARGAEVIACDIDADRRALAEEIGVTCIDPSAGDLAEQVFAQWEEGADAVFEVTARPEMAGIASTLLKARPWDGTGKAPRLVLQANYTESFSFGARELFQREAMVLSPRASAQVDREDAAKMIADGVLNLENLVPERSRPEDAADEYATLMGDPGRQVTALFDWGEM